LRSRSCLIRTGSQCLTIIQYHTFNSSTTLKLSRSPSQCARDNGPAYSCRDPHEPVITPHGFITFPTTHLSRSPDSTSAVMPNPTRLGFAPASMLMKDDPSYLSNTKSQSDEQAHPCSCSTIKRITQRKSYYKQSKSDTISGGSGLSEDGNPRSVPLLQFILARPITKPELRIASVKDPVLQN
jgi:hypothetical protein